MVLAIGAGLVLAACSSGGSGAGPTTTGAGSVPPATEPAATAPPAPATSSTTTPPRSAPATVAYDNTAAGAACTLLSADDVAAAFGGPAEPGVPLDPYCQWRVGTEAFVGLTIYPQRPISSFRGYGGLAVGNVDDLADGGFWASNKWLFFGWKGTTYALQFQRGAEWTDANRPKLRQLADRIAARLGVPPKPPTTPPTLPPPPDAPTTVATTTTTTTMPPPPTVAPPAPLARPTGRIDPGRALSAAQPLRIWVGGDSIAGGPAWAVGQQARATGVAAVDTEFQVGTGLARPDFFDWRRHLAAIADARDPEVMILLFGANDIQPLVLPDGATVAWGDERWLPEYRRRVAAIMDDLAVRGRHVVWVGLPPMEDAEYSQQMVALNEIFRTEAEARAPYVTYVDLWAAFSPAGQPGVFTRDLPGPDGQPVRVRFDDIHFNVPGSELLATRLLGVVRTFAPLP